MPSIKDCFIFTPNLHQITKLQLNRPVLRLTELEKTRIMEQSNVRDLATAKGNGKFISYHYDEVSILILAIVIVLIIREKRAEDLIWKSC